MPSQWPGAIRSEYRSSPGASHGDWFEETRPIMARGRQGGAAPAGRSPSRFDSELGALPVIPNRPRCAPRARPCTRTVGRTVDHGNAVGRTPSSWGTPELPSTLALSMEGAEEGGVAVDRKDQELTGVRGSQVKGTGGVPPANSQDIRYWKSAMSRRVSPLTSPFCRSVGP